MNDCIKAKNIKLLNLVEKGHSSFTLMKVINAAVDNFIDEDFIIHVLGNTPTCKSIIADFRLLDTTYYSVWCLRAFDFNIITIEKLYSKFKTLEELVKDKQGFEELHLNVNSINKLFYALEVLGQSFDEVIEIDELKRIITDLIKQNEPIQNNQLKETLYSLYKRISSSDIDDVLDNLLREKKIFISIEGYKIKKPDLCFYLSNSDNEADKIFLKVLSGFTYEEVALSYGITRQRVEQIIKKQTNKYPIFEKEKEYYSIFKEYIYEKEFVELLNFNEPLIRYVKYKYGIKPKAISNENNFLKYLVSYGQVESDIGKKYLEEKSFCLINGQIVKRDFINLFTIFVNDNNIHRFNFDDLVVDYNGFLTKNRIEDKKVFVDSINLDVLARKLYNNSRFINVEKNIYLVYNADSLSSEFLDKTREYLEDFEGYGSVKYFYDRNKELCVSNFLNDEKDLFALLKELYSKEFSKKIDFIRNPVICEKGVDKIKYIENMILDLELPSTVENYLDYIYENTGLNRNSILANFSKMINKYRNKEGLISLDDDLDKETSKTLVEILSGVDCFGNDYFEKIIDMKLKIEPRNIMNISVLGKFGYCYTRDVIYKNTYNNKNDALYHAISKMDYIITKNDLYRICDKKYLKCSDFSDLSYIVQIGNDKYLNLIKRGQIDVLNDLKKNLKNVINDNVIYNLDIFMETSSYKDRLLNANTEYSNLLYSFDDKEILKSTICSMKEFSYIRVSDSIIFSKEKLSYQVVLSSMLKEYGSMSLLELQEKLYELYLIEKKFSNCELAEMGFYCPFSSEKVYLNKEYYNLEMEEILNGNT